MKMINFRIMERKSLKKNFSQVPVIFSRLSYVESYKKKLNSIKSSKTIPKNEEKIDSPIKITRVSRVDPFLMRPSKTICDISSIKGDNSENSLWCTVTEYRNLFVSPLKEKTLKNLLKKQQRPSVGSPGIMERKYSKPKSIKF